MFAEDLTGFTLATVVAIAAVLALGWVEGVVVGRRARRSSSPAAPIAAPFVASTETLDPSPRRPAGV